VSPRVCLSYSQIVSDVTDVFKNIDQITSLLRSFVDGENHISAKRD